MVIFASNPLIFVDEGYMEWSITRRLQHLVLRPPSHIRTVTHIVTQMSTLTHPQQLLCRQVSAAWSP
jgi:hypothetical protein